MLFTESRRAARTGPGDILVLLADQDRNRRDRDLIAEARSLVRRCLRRDRPGPYQLQAAINAVHSDTAIPADTDWRQIQVLYDHLLTIFPTPVVALNRAVAVAEVTGPSALAIVVEDLDLDSNHLFHAIRTDLPRRLGRLSEAAQAYDAAIARAGNTTERAFSEDRRRTLKTSR